ncbi:hypothetical protein [Aquisphaera insulae]|uniref:hypothetical protein n=1 Tax=Aquisphaera insulae TaxID=2712864 RepID=UPI0013E9C726|nr:hypothetical protein [Aquisphaera insulae]
MNPAPLASGRASHVRADAIEGYAESLGWIRVLDVNGPIAVYHRPGSPLHQLIIPLDESYDDYGETVAEAVRKLAAFEERSPAEVLELLLDRSASRRRLVTPGLPSVPNRGS